MRTPSNFLLNKRQSMQKRTIQKLATQGTQDEEKQNKNTTQYVLNITIRKQTQITRNSGSKDT